MTVLMHSWYYEKKDLKRSPSISGGLDLERESRYRREGARFIINIGTKMGLRYDTMATGVVYFHRFYMSHSFKTFPRYVTACCCLFLAGKVEETPKKCKDIIRTAKSFLAESQFAQFGDDPKEEVMTLERILLQTIKFDLQVDHPYGHLLKYAKSLKGDKIKLQNMVQMAWTFINDSLCTTLCLQWEPEVIAIALMHLAGKLSKFEVVDWNGRTARHKDWWDMFVEGMSIELLEDICHQVLDLYSMPNPKTPQDSPPATPPTKLTRKTSQPPSPIETTVETPAQIKPKDPPVGLPIPRLEPGELKRKASLSEKDLNPEPAKMPRVMEGKAIPTISTRSPRTAPSSLGSDTNQSSPSPPRAEPVKSIKEISQRSMSEPVYKTNLQPKISHYAPSSVFQSSDSVVVPKVVSQVPSTSYSVSIPPPTSTYTQSVPSYFPDTQPFPNIQQPPPQIYPQRPPVSFQHLPSVPPSGPPLPPPGLLPIPHQYTPNMPPPFNSQFPPPPRHQPPPNMSNPPPAPSMTQHPPPGAPPVPSMIRSVPPPPPPGVHPVRHMVQDNLYRPGPDIYSPDQRGRPPKDRLSMSQDFGSRSQYEGNYHGHQDSDYESSYQRDTGYCRPPPPPPPPNKFNQDMNVGARPQPQTRRFYLAHQSVKKHERGPLPRMGNPQQHGGPTGIPHVRITGSK